MMSTDCVIVGAGPAGLASSCELSRRGVPHLVLERGDRVGHTWAHLYDGLVLHTGKRLSALPGMQFDRAVPTFPTRLQLLEYLDRYCDVFRVPVRTGIEVTSVLANASGWTIATADGSELRAANVIVATGIVSNPQRPSISGADRFAGTLVHSVAYRRPEIYAGRRVLIVGAGNSAGEIAAELAAAGAMVSVSVRSGRRVVPRAMLGLPSHYVANVTAALPRWMQRRIVAAASMIGGFARGPSPLPRPSGEACVDVPLIGFHLVDAVRAGAVRLRPHVKALTSHGAEFQDGSRDAFDDVLLATGYRPALKMLGDAVTIDRCGFAQRSDRVTSADASGLYFVGHTYDSRGALRNIAIDSALAAARIAARRRHA